MGNQVIGIEIFDGKESSVLTVLYKKSQETTEVEAGNNIVIFDKHFNTVFKLTDTKYYYTTIFKWISFDVPDTISIALTAVMSRRIHLLTVNIVQVGCGYLIMYYFRFMALYFGEFNTYLSSFLVKEKVLNSEILPLDHNLRSVKTFAGENYCVTFSCDGTYNLYKFDDGGQWKKIIMVNCSHWQTGGLKAVQVDDNGCNILTLSLQGNFMCTGFK